MGIDDGAIAALPDEKIRAIRLAARRLANRPNDTVSERFAYESLLKTLGAERDPGSPSDPRVALAVHKLESEPGESLSLEDLARHVGLSPGRFRHVFRQQMGMSAQSYRVWLRLREACTRLVGGAPLTRTALDSGFADAAHFSRTFRRTFGLAPSQIARAMSPSAPSPTRRSVSERIHPSRG
jgi:transcriptional regulator GlxA family with amidase domain